MGCKLAEDEVGEVEGVEEVVEVEMVEDGFWFCSGRLFM